MPTTLHIALALPNDAPDIANMSRRLIEPGLPWTWRPWRVGRAFLARNTNVAMVRARGGLAGFGIMEYREDDAHLVLFAVEPTHRRQGVGSAILRWLEASAAAGGARRIRLEARRDNDAARLFYNEHGFHEVAIVRGRYGDAVDGLRLEKWLCPRPEA